MLAGGSSEGVDVVLGSSNGAVSPYPLVVGVYDFSVSTSDMHNTFHDTSVFEAPFYCVDPTVATHQIRTLRCANELMTNLSKSEPSKADCILIAFFSSLLRPAD